MRRYALKEFVRNIKFNIFIIIQLAFVFAMIVFAVSSVLQNLRYYIPLSDYLSDDGAYIFAHRPVADLGKDKNSLSGYSEYFDEALFAEQVSLSKELTDDELAQSQSGNFAGVKNPYDANAYSYYKNVADLYTPIIIDGDWISEVDKYSKDNDILHAVITENNYGLKVGDIYTQSLPVSESGYKNFKIKIIGIMKSGTRSFGMITRYRSDIALDAKEMFKSYDVNQEGIPLVLFSAEELDRINCSRAVLGGMMVKFKDGLSDEEYKNAINSTYSLGTSVEFKEIRENSLKEIKNQMTVLAPIIGGIILLVIVSVLSMSAVNTNKQLRNYGIYYMCGCRWRQCAMINTLSILISEVSAAILAYVAMKVAQILGLLSSTVVSLGKWQFIGCLFIVVITLIAALIMPVLIIGRSTPREIIKASR